MMKLMQLHRLKMELHQKTEQNQLQQMTQPEEKLHQKAERNQCQAIKKLQWVAATQVAVQLQQMMQVVVHHLQKVAAKPQ